MTESKIRIGLAQIEQIDPKLAAKVKRKVAGNLIGFNQTKEDERVSAVKQLAVLPKEAELLKELIASQFVTHPDDRVREEIIGLILKLSNEEKRHLLLKRMANRDPNERIAGLARAMFSVSVALSKKEPEK